MDQSPGTVSTSQIDVNIKQNSVSLFSEDTGKEPLIEYMNLGSLPSAPHFPQSSSISAYHDYLSLFNQDPLRNSSYAELMSPFDRLRLLSTITCFPEGCCDSMKNHKCMRAVVSSSMKTAVVEIALVDGVVIVLWRTSFEVSEEPYHLDYTRGRTVALQRTWNSDRWALYIFLIKEVLKDLIRDTTIIRTCNCFNRFQSLYSLKLEMTLRHFMSGSAVLELYKL